MNLTKYANKTHQNLLILYKNHMQVIFKLQVKDYDYMFN